ncbi:MAG: hypothetical protein K1X53_01465 [Candidatus Sumerlaeaceae bacterium]|nr:hypothetical protein [Candidatus Sumerlaeaceae bacterium]
MNELPGCDELFERFFAPWYSEADRLRRRMKATYPDLITDPELVGLSQSAAGALAEQHHPKILEIIDGVTNAACRDWPGYLPVYGELDLSWIDEFDRHYGRDEISKVIARSDATDFGNEYLVLCCEFGAAIAGLFRKARPTLRWSLDWPYWDSTLFDPVTGKEITVFHWGIKKMSEYGVDDGFAAKLKACLKILDQH